MSKILYAASTASHIKSFHLDYIEALRRDGHEVLTMAKGDGVDFDIPFEKRMLSKTNGKCRKMIRRIVKEENFDLIILNTSLVAFHIRAAIKGKCRPRILNIVHGYLFPKKSPLRLKAKIKRLMLLFAEKAVRGKTDAILTMNLEDYEIATKHRLSAGTVTNTLGMGIKKSEISDVNSARRDLSEKDGEFVMLFVGELSSRKNEEYLIKLMPKIKERISCARLCLIGEGDMRSELLALAEGLGVCDSVSFLGRKENPARFMAAADVYVSASKSEGLPFNVVEALGAGVPVIATDVKGHKDILEDGAGVLFAQNDDEALLEALENVYTGKYIRNDNAVAAATAKFGFDNVFSDTYEKIKKAGELA
jgi:glycosyltransferase EpsD